MQFRAGKYEYAWPRPPLIMGVLNVTPDSFSDGGRFVELDAAVAHALKLAQESADIIDVGGESTRPGAELVAEKEELRRVIPVIRELKRVLTIPISVDTTKPAVAEAALDAGASLVNDIAGDRSDSTMWQVTAQAKAGYVLMHRQGIPATMQNSPVYSNILQEIDAFFGSRLEALSSAGVSPESVLLDIGIGFGKTVEHNLRLLAHLDTFAHWNRPLAIGVSRKSFLGKLTGAADPEARLPAALAATVWCLARGASVIRTHDVAPTRQALVLAETLIRSR